MKKKFLIFVLMLATCFSCMFFVGCGSKKETNEEQQQNIVTLSHLQVFYGDMDISQGTSLKMTMLDSLKEFLESKLKVNLVYSDGKSVSLAKDSKNGYKVANTVPTILIPGDYTYTISYNNLDKVVINIEISKTYDTITINNMDKSYDGEPISTPKISTINEDEEPIIEWFLSNGTKLESAPKECGEYYIQVTTQSTSEFYETVATKYFIINKAIPSVNSLPEVKFDGVYYYNKELSLDDFVLPANFVWNEEQNITLGENVYYATYTPEDLEHYYKLSTYGITIIVKEKIEKPTKIVGEYVFNGTQQKAEFDNNSINFDCSEEFDDFYQTNAGNYKIVLKLVDKTKYCWADGTDGNIEFDWEIKKCNPSYQPPVFEKLSAQDVTVLEDVKLPENFAWQEGQLLEEGINTYYLIYTPLDTNNYNIITDIEVEITYYIHEALKTPEITLDGIFVSSYVDNAENYEVEIYKDEVLEESFNAEYLHINLLSYKEEYANIKLGIRVKALAEGDYYLDSDWSEMFEYTFESLTAPVLVKGNNSVSWEAVENATGYSYKVNDGEVITIEADQLSIQLEPADKVVVCALGTGTLFNDSDWSNEVAIDKQKVDVPTITNNNITSDGTNLKVQIVGYNSKYMSLLSSSDNIYQTQSGVYLFTFSLKDTNKYTWADGTTEDKTIYWTIL